MLLSLCTIKCIDNSMQKKITNQSSVSLQQLTALLELEYRSEKQAYEVETKAAGIEKRIRQGKCWYPLFFGKAFYNALNHYVVEVHRSASDEREHEFEPGKSVTFFRTNTFEDPIFLPIIGQVTFVEGSRILVVLPNVEALVMLQKAGQVGMQLYFDESSYTAMFETLHSLEKTENKRLNHMKQVFYGGLKPAERSFYPVRFPWLNTSQEQAVNKVLCAKDVAIIHGPPGTGKTTTLVEAIYETLHREPQVLVCAQSNAAVDWICEKLSERGVAVLRVGNPLRVNDKMLSLTYERRFEAHPDYPELWALRKQIRRVQQEARKGQSRSESVRDQLAKMRNRMTALEIQIDADLFGETRVVASTLIGSANKVMSHKCFSTLFIDEAAQALQPACWVAMRKANRVILAGDHCQLPPTVKSREAMQGGLGITLLEQVLHAHPECVSLLTLQYRMHETIMQFSSDYFYGGQLKASPDIAHRTLSYLEHSMEWYDTQLLDMKEQQSSHSLSRYNQQEAELLIELLVEMVERITVIRMLEERIDIGIISPYKAQVYLLRGIIKRENRFRKLKHLITVHSVDGFQGQERDIIVVSMVRGNAEQKIGFLSDLRRMNVAITRARMKLIVLGDAQTLSTHRFYERLYRHIGENGKVHLLEPSVLPKID